MHDRTLSPILNPQL